MSSTTELLDLSNPLYGETSCHHIEGLKSR